MKKPVSVLVVIHTDALDVLLLERRSHEGYWQSVTGSQEGDEPIETTAHREVLEETGIVSEDGLLTAWNQSNRFEIFAEWRHRYPDGVTHNVETVFSLALPRRVPVRISPDEHRDAIWLPAPLAAEKVFSWTNRDAILTLALQRARH